MMRIGSETMPMTHNLNLLHTLTEVFQLEIDTLIKVRDSLGDPYVQAAELIFECRGKVVISGMGKSGLIAQKIAATMVSTGTEALFLHPADACHGDIGIINTGDIVIAISKSGHTEELLAILMYVRKLGVPIISITANSDSALAMASDLVLVTPVDAEACPLNLTPTSSTTAALVVGDALAMTLMKMRGFQPEQFALFHPSGRLGRRLLLNVSDIMRSGANNPIINIDDDVQHMLYEISSKRCGAVSVVDQQQHLLGLITDYDVRNVLEQRLDLFSFKMAGIMNPNPTCIYSDEKAVDALDIMQDRAKPFLVLPALDRKTNQVVGMIHVHDLLAQGL